MRGPRRSPLTRVGRWLIVLGFSALLAFPFYWMFITTFKQTGDLYNLENNPVHLQRGADARAPQAPLRGDALPPLALEHDARRRGVVAITLLLAVPAAYALARLTGRGGSSSGSGSS